MIIGGKRLVGDVFISGAKNAAVAVIPATILVEGTCRIENIPSIDDVTVIVDLLKYLGAKVKFTDKHTLEINCEKLKGFSPPHDMVRKLRASYYLIGALLGRFNHAEVPPPGGCNFGTRPIDMHIKGFEALGAKVNIDKGIVEAHATKLNSAQIFLDLVSVGATINIMLAAVRAEGTTIIENAAKEPHVVDVANFLNAMGANVKGAGTDIIKIKGVEKMTGGTYTIIPDQIEAGTFMIAAAATAGDIVVRNVIPKHLESISAKLVEMNAVVEEYDDSIRVTRNLPLQKANIKTLPYPGFPTDLQPQIVALLSVAQGTSIITENVWDNRFQYIDELRRFGAKINVDGKVAVIEGVESLSGAPVKATDLRAGASMVIAALMAKGMTEIHELRHIDRGYENLEQKLRALGAQIVRRESEETDIVGEVI
ncbi:MAG: UDP-N-acetylglucosamine 1-carboxyvinyltransferase 2 [Firmicutes bacterium ADurb.Bin193]|nr:MAG: UDP-N-acetylglucosamine 1-carboxyvinyltransferase 2 [Firmicutes bacterium ADurb.Bin193]